MTDKIRRILAAVMAAAILMTGIPFSFAEEGQMIELTPEQIAELTAAPEEVSFEEPKPAEEAVLEHTKITEEPVAESTVEITAESTVEETPEATIEVTLEPTTDPVAEPTVEVEVTPEPHSTEEPTVEPTPELMPEVNVEPSFEPNAEPSAEPAVEPTTEPTEELLPQSAQELAEYFGFELWEIAEAFEMTEEELLLLSAEEIAVLYTQIQEMLGGVAVMAASDFVIENGVLTKYNGTDSEVRIPNTTKTIGSNAFEGNGYIKKIIIPSSVVGIEGTSLWLEGAFAGCDSLEEVYIEGNSMEYIGGHAFELCSSLRKINFPSSLREIGQSAFANCEKLVHIELPVKLKKIAVAAFGACGLEEIVIPGTVDTIEYGSFRYCKSLKKVIIQDGVKRIDDPKITLDSGAFADCSALTTVIIEGESLQYIGRSAFRNCSQLKSIILPNKLQYIGADAFSGCRSLNSINIPDNVYEIGKCAFFSCKSLVQINLPKKLKTLGYAAFAFSGLETIIIPGSLETIESGTFYRCESLTNVTIQEGIKTISNSLYVQETRAIAGVFEECTALTKVIIEGNSLQHIGNDAFERCGGEFTIEIPDSVKTLGWNVFLGDWDAVVWVYRDSPAHEYCEANYQKQGFTYKIRGSEPPAPTPYLSWADPDYGLDNGLYSSATGGKGSTIGITSNVSWKVTGPSWVRFEPSNGSGNGSFTVYVNANTGAAREGYIAVSSSGCATLQMKITQEAGKTKKFSFEEDYVTNGIQVKPGETWSWIYIQDRGVIASSKIISGSSWLEVEDWDWMIELYMPKNTTGKDRYATIEISAPGYETARIQITQYGKCSHEEAEAFYVDKNGDYIYGPEDADCKQVDKYSHSYQVYVSKHIVLCWNCDETLASTTINKNMTITEPHYFNEGGDGKGGCYYCHFKASMGCKHPSYTQSVNKYEYFNEQKHIHVSYQLITDENFRYIICNDCGTYGEIFDGETYWGCSDWDYEANSYKSIFEDHVYTNGKCPCGYEKKTIYPSVSNFKLSATEVTVGESISLSGTVSGNGVKLDVITVNVRDAATEKTGGTHWTQSGINFTSYSLSNIPKLVAGEKIGSSNAVLSPGRYVIEVYAKNVEGTVLASRQMLYFTVKEVGKLSLSGSTILTAGKSTTLSVNQAGNIIPNKNLSWTTSDKTIATVSRGKVSAKKAGIVTITATARDKSIGSIEITILPSPASVAIFKNGAELKKNSTLEHVLNTPLQLSAQVYPSNADQIVTWKSSSTKIAAIAVDGTVTPLKEGTTTISAKTVNGKSTSIKLKIVDPYKPTGIELSESGTISVGVGESLKLGYSLKPDTAKAELTWTSSNARVATVDTDGNITGLKAGTTTITVKTHNNKKDTVNVKVIKIDATPARDFKYEISDGKCTITEYSESDVKVIVPAKIEGHPVTSIGDYAFYWCDNLASITIPNSVTSIGNYAFYWCDSLTSITIPNSVTSIGECAFQECINLASITIPNSVTSIGWGAFNFCNNLPSITIPSSVTSIDWGAFAGCTKLAAISVESNNKVYSSLDGVLFNKEKTTLLAYPAGNMANNYVIPNNVSFIDKFAFFNCDNLNSVTIEGPSVEIGENAFAGCDKLTSVTIKGANTIIGKGAFDHYSDNLVIFAPAGSHAERYAKENGLEFKAISQGYAYLHLAAGAPTELTAYHGGGQGSPIGVESNVVWSASSNVDWIHPRADVENGLLSASYDANNGVERRGSIFLTADGCDTVEIQVVQLAMEVGEAEIFSVHFSCNAQEAKVGETFTLTVVTNDQTKKLRAVNNSGTGFKNPDAWTTSQNADGTITWTRSYIAEDAIAGRYWIVTPYNANDVAGTAVDSNKIDITAPEYRVWYMLNEKRDEGKFVTDGTIQLTSENIGDKISIYLSNEDGTQKWHPSDNNNTSRFYYKVKGDEGVLSLMPHAYQGEILRLGEVIVEIWDSETNTIVTSVRVRIIKQMPSTKAYYKLNNIGQKKEVENGVLVVSQQEVKNIQIYAGDRHPSDNNGNTSCYFDIQILDGKNVLYIASKHSFNIEVRNPGHALVEIRDGDELLSSVEVVVLPNSPLDWYEITQTQKDMWYKLIDRGDIENSYLFLSMPEYYFQQLNEGNYLEQLYLKGYSQYSQYVASCFDYSTPFLVAGKIRNYLNSEKYADEVFAQMIVEYIYNFDVETELETSKLDYWIKGLERFLPGIGNVVDAAKMADLALALWNFAMETDTGSNLLVAFKDVNGLLTLGFAATKESVEQLASMVTAYVVIEKIKLGIGNLSSLPANMQKEITVLLDRMTNELISFGNVTKATIKAAYKKVLDTIIKEALNGAGAAVGFPLLGTAFIGLKNAIGSIVNASHIKEIGLDIEYLLISKKMVEMAEKELKEAAVNYANSPSLPDYIMLNAKKEAYRTYVATSLYWYYNWSVMEAESDLSNFLPGGENAETLKARAESEYKSDLRKLESYLNGI